ncbi:hypothetical protein ABZ379_45530 [Streptomyces canus]|uniref:hypothetical protein n=1 Tax=Streptomyces canus TaxID=58343 RepID=UPI0033DCA326
MDRAAIHVLYAQVIGRAGEFPAKGAGYGRTVQGRSVDSFLRGNLTFWLSSDARMADDGVIRYRRGRNHSVVTFVPDKTSGVLINRPDEQLTAAAYRVTGPTGTSQLWRGATVRAAITACRIEPPVGWPAGWAHLMPDQTIKFASGGAPWSREAIYTAEPTDEPDSWGPPCPRCARLESEHGLWSGRASDGTGCWTFPAQEA